MNNNALEGVTIDLVGDQLTNWNVNIRGPVIQFFHFWRSFHFAYPSLPYLLRSYVFCVGRDPLRRRKVRRKR